MEGAIAKLLELHANSATVRISVDQTYQSSKPEGSAQEMTARETSSRVSSRTAAGRLVRVRAARTEPEPFRADVRTEWAARGPRTSGRKILPGRARSDPAFPSAAPEWHPKSLVRQALRTRTGGSSTPAHLAGPRRGGRNEFGGGKSHSGKGTVQARFAQCLARCKAEHSGSRRTCGENPNPAWLEGVTYVRDRTTVHHRATTEVPNFIERLAKWWRWWS